MKSVGVGHNGEDLAADVVVRSLDLLTPDAFDVLLPDVNGSATRPDWIHGGRPALDFTRRDFVRLSLGSAACAATPRLVGQGVAAHTVRPLARPTPSGRPFNAHFVDVASAAGLHAPVVYGGTRTKNTFWKPPVAGARSSITTMTDGSTSSCCRNAAGGRSAGATNRLYKNNRDGTFTDVTEKAGEGLGWASAVCVGDYNNDGFEDIFYTAWAKSPLPEQRRWNVHRCHQGGRAFGKERYRAGVRDAVFSTTTGMGTWIFRLELCPFFLACAGAGSKRELQLERIPVECGPRGCPWKPSLYRNNGDGTFTDVSQQAGIANNRKLRNDRGGCGFR